jgi:very-short-patch-repair endonuclease
LLEYIVFFGLLAVGFLTYIISPKPDPLVNLVAAERYKCESPIERRLYDAMVFHGYAVQTQVQCGKYQIDLALMSPRIAIECDGKAYHSSPQQKAHDRRKDAYLRDQGWRVVRISGREITRNLGKVIKRIDAKMTE